MIYGDTHDTLHAHMYHIPPPLLHRLGIDPLELALRPASAFRRPGETEELTQLRYSNHEALRQACHAPVRVFTGHRAATPHSPRACGCLPSCPHLLSPPSTLPAADLSYCHSSCVTRGVLLFPQFRPPTQCRSGCVHSWMSGGTLRRVAARAITALHQAHTQVPVQKPSSCG
jgi:hypothetical protein